MRAPWRAAGSAQRDQRLATISGASCSSARARRKASSCLRSPAPEARQPSRASTRVAGRNAITGEQMVDELPGGSSHCGFVALLGVAFTIVSAVVTGPNQLLTAVVAVFAQIAAQPSRPR